MRLTKTLKEEILSKAISAVFNKDIEDLDNRLKKHVKDWMDKPEQAKLLKAYDTWVKAGHDPAIIRATSRCTFYSRVKDASSRSICYETNSEFNQLFGYDRLPRSLPSTTGCSVSITLPENTPEYVEYTALYKKRKETKALFEGILDSVTTAKRLREVCPELAEFLPADQSIGSYLVPIDVARKASETLQAAFTRNTAA
jgi:hypothetical protein